LFAGARTYDGDAPAEGDMRRNILGGHKLGAIAVATVSLAVGAAWITQRPPGTEPAPLDVLLEEAGAADAPEASVAATRAAAGVASDVAAAGGSGAGANAADDAVVGGVVSFRGQPLEPTPAWDLTRAMNDRVEFWIDFLKGRNRDRTQLWLEREGRYGGYIRAQLRERGMPEDLLYLGMIESGLSPRAYSKAHAAGLWQFIAETGRRYGLEVSTYVDERRDPVAATTAALDYLSDLHERFGSWYLAAAGYNSGENRVERILRQRAGGRTGDDGLFWLIDGYLPRETRDYVPLMLAAAHIGKDPGSYGFHEVVLQAPLAFDEVEVEGGTPLRLVAEASSADLEEVEDLNPHLVRGVTPPGRSWRVRVPAGTGGEALARLPELMESRDVASVTHQVRRGETLSHIARRYGVRVDALQLANGHLNPRRLRVGEIVTVPVDGVAVTSTTDARTYRVQRGDTLWEIARRHGVSVHQIRSWNGIGSRIYPGQRLRLGA
ncbi:MAG TPA: LysM peptidoglycan-binding domain-containing protein, partial [Longimicrobiales bacterium]|nr:LysM peptidoglycan-binding domain-containing protein [Longimicrobiales bacterium]